MEVKFNYGKVTMERFPRDLSIFTSHKYFAKLKYVSKRDRTERMLLLKIHKNQATDTDLKIVIYRIAQA